MENIKLENIKMDLEVSLDRVGDLLCSAFEGGSNYWYRIDYDKSEAPKEINYDFFGYEENGKKYVFRHVNWPLTGGKLFVFDRDAEEDDEDRFQGYLDLEACKKGLKLMAEKYPRHYGDFADENDDADTGDVFLQLALFGDIIFG